MCAPLGHFQVDMSSTRGSEVLCNDHRSGYCVRKASPRQRVKTNCRDTSVVYENSQERVVHNSLRGTKDQQEALTP